MTAHSGPSSTGTSGYLLTLTATSFSCAQGWRTRVAVRSVAHKAVNRPPAHARSHPRRLPQHESVGYVLEGQAELQIEGQKLLLKQGDSWLVPPNAQHSYKVLSEEPFRALEATSNPPTL